MGVFIMTVEVQVINLSPYWSSVLTYKLHFGLTARVCLCALQNEDLRHISMQGFAKLMLAGRLVSSKMLLRLFLLWFNPACDDDLLLRQTLAAFFPAFAFGSRYFNSVCYHLWGMTCLADHMCQGTVQIDDFPSVLICDCFMWSNYMYCK